MPFIPLTNSESSVEVSEEDYMTLLLLGPFRLIAKGYPATTKHPRQYLHHLVAARMGLVLKDKTIDHKDRNKLNAKRDNLQAATVSEQGINTELRSDNVSGFKCINWDSKSRKWKVQVTRNNKANYVGLYTTIEEALKERNAFLTKHNLAIED